MKTRNDTRKKGRTRLSAKDRRNAITRAVIPTFAEKGFAATTTKDLAKAADVSEALLYRHFPSKESLYEHIQNAICSTDSSIHDYVKALPTGSEGIVKLVYLAFKILFEIKTDHPLGSSVIRMQIQSFLEDGSFARSFNKPRFNEMLPHMQASAEVAIAAGEMAPEPLTHFERHWFSHHLALALRLAELPADAVFDYQSSPKDRLLHGVWFSLRGIGLKDNVIRRYLIPEDLDPVIDDLLVRAGVRVGSEEAKQA